MAPRIFQSDPADGVQFDNVLSLCEKTSAEERSVRSKKASKIQFKECPAQVLPSELAIVSSQNDCGELLLEISKLLGE